VKPLRVVTVGHVTNDALADAVHPGGAALYAGLAAQLLGAEVTLLTRAGPDFVGSHLLGLLHAAQVQPAPRTTAFDERYTGAGRSVRLLYQAAPVDAAVPPADVVLLCPVADEVPSSALALRPTRLLAAGLQGWLRAFGKDGAVAARSLPDARAFSGCGLVSCSEEDLAGLGPRTLSALRATVPLVAVTDGASGARLYQGQKGWHIPPLSVAAQDPTGAGDVFLAVLALYLARGTPPFEAAGWASCAAALTTTRAGPGALTALKGLQEAWNSYRRQTPPPRSLDA
jgi:sugar/nucleoside kinase (ribokinase family)